MRTGWGHRRARRACIFGTNASFQGQCRLSRYNKQARVKTVASLASQIAARRRRGLLPCAEWGACAVLLPHAATQAARGCMVAEQLRSVTAHRLPRRRRRHLPPPSCDCAGGRGGSISTGICDACTARSRYSTVQLPAARPSIQQQSAKKPSFFSPPVPDGISLAPRSRSADQFTHGSTCSSGEYMPALPPVARCAVSALQRHASG